MTNLLEAVHAATGALPRVHLTALPTPFERLSNLSNSLGVNLWVKRDDLTGLALGGNKVRELEFHLGEALETGADAVITTGNSQSNHARTTAAACSKLGIECYLVLEQGLKPRNGNLLLDQLFGAHIEILPVYTPHIADAAMDACAARLRTAGRRPYTVPFGGCSPTGIVGFVGAAVELCMQLDAEHMNAETLYMATASCGTQAGILAGIAAAGRGLRVRGISVSDPRNVQEEQVHRLANLTLGRLGLTDTVPRANVEVDDSFVGEGYGLPTLGTWEAVVLAAQSEGLLVDPVYTGKAMAALLDHVRTGVIPEGATVVFLHTGGVPALFAYGEDAHSRVRDASSERNMDFVTP